MMSERVKDLAVVYLHKYRFIKKYKDGLLIWLSSNKSCSMAKLISLMVFQKPFVRA